MKKIILSLTVLLSVISLTSCDKDFNTIGSEIVEGDHFDFEKIDLQVSVETKQTGPVQSNNLSVNHLGIYNDPAFGVTKASLVSQLELINENPIVGNVGTQVIDSVYIYIPYFVDSGETITGTDGSKTYVLDSVYGYDETAKFKLSVYENGYFIRNLDPNDNFESSQKYFTNDKATKIDPFKGSELLNNSSNSAQNDLFYISNKEKVIYKTNGSGLYVNEDGVVLTNQTDASIRVVKERKAPGIWLDLKKNFFQDKLFGSLAAGKLYNNTVFKDYFRGLLFEVEEITPGVGSLATLDFSKAELKVLYKSENTFTNSSGGTITTVTSKNLTLGLGYNGTSRTANTINLIDYDFTTSYTDGLADTSGENLYIKGGNGSVVYIDIPLADIVALRLRKLLVNEANLIFHINTDSYIGMGSAGQVEPERIYLFDATNNTPILDYYDDGSTNADSKKNKSGFGGIIQKQKTSPKKGIKYKINITSHLNRVLNGDVDENENIRLGLVVTENINIFSNAFLANPSFYGVTRLPFGQVMSPLGTVLHGPNSADLDKRLKLEIYYTEPTN